MIGVTLFRITLPNILLLNLYFENSNTGLHVLYVLNMHVNFHVNWMLFIIRLVNLFFIHYFKLQNLNLNN